MLEIEVQEKRLATFTKLMKGHHQEPNDYDEGEEEDPRPYFAGEEKLERFCCVTSNYSSHGSEKVFFLPVFAERDAAELRAVEYARDDCFEEVPLEVVDLDTGQTWEPDWSKLQWKTVN